MEEQNKEPSKEPKNPLLEHLSKDDLLLTADLQLFAKDGTVIANIKLQTPIPAVLESDNATVGQHQFNKVFEALITRPMQMKVGRHIRAAANATRARQAQEGIISDDDDTGYTLPPPPPMQP